MALQRDNTYPGRWGVANADYPGGVPKNRTAPDAKDGTWFEADWVKDIHGFLDSLVENGNITRSKVPDTAQASDYYDGMIASVAAASKAWVGTTNYTHPTTAIGSDGLLYITLQNSGPGSGGAKNPVSEPTYWVPVGVTAVKSITGGTGITVTESDGDYTVSSTVTGWPGLYPGTTRDNLDFPVGSYILASSGTAMDRNATTTVRLGVSSFVDSGYAYTGSASVLTGTWRNRGLVANQIVLFQRVL